MCDVFVQNIANR